MRLGTDLEARPAFTHSLLRAVHQLARSRLAFAEHLRNFRVVQFEHLAQQERCA
jgi:hypothetical protein